jgi:ABC-type lipoprotein release transport system permease subunit
MATVVAIVLVVATLAALPAMRAALIEPLQVLREG